MKVRDLIARLQEMDPELPVTVLIEEDDDGVWSKELKPEDIKATFTPYRPDHPEFTWAVYRQVRLG